MKRLLLSVLIGLLIALTAYVMLQGAQIGSINILSLQGLEEKDSQLNSEIQNATKLSTTDYKKALSELESSTQKLQNTKKNYESMVATTSAEDVASAKQLEKYEVEYLWTKIGNHATAEGITLKMDIVTSTNTSTSTSSSVKTSSSTTSSSGTNTTSNDQVSYNGSVSGNSNNSSSTVASTSKLYNLNFTVSGDYVGIADFIYAIENDSSLGFKIEQFKMIPGSGDSALTATFICKDIEIKNIDQSAVTTDSSTTNSNESTTGNTTNTTNSSNSTNSNTSTDSNSNNTSNNTNSSS